MHWCMDETLAVLAMIPFIGYFFAKLHAWWHKHVNHECHEKDCHAHHVEHCHMLPNLPHGKVGEGQCEQHPLEAYSPYNRSEWHKDQQVSEADMEYLRGTPAPLKITIPVTIWDNISQDDVSERFGEDMVIFLYKEVADAGITDDLSKDEVHWMVNDKAELRVEVRGKVFLHDYECCEWGWRVES